MEARSPRDTSEEELTDHKDPFHWGIREGPKKARQSGTYFWHLLRQEVKVQEELGGGGDDCSLRH